VFFYLVAWTAALAQGADSTVNGIQLSLIPLSSLGYLWVSVARYGTSSRGQQPEKHTGIRKFLYLFNYNRKQDKNKVANTADTARCRTASVSSQGGAALKDVVAAPEAVVLHRKLLPMPHDSKGWVKVRAELELPPPPPSLDPVRAQLWSRLHYRRIIGGSIPPSPPQPLPAPQKAIPEAAVEERGELVDSGRFNTESIPVGVGTEF